MIIRDLTKAKDRWYTLQYDHLQLGEYTIKHSPHPSSVRSTGVNRINREHQQWEVCSILREGQDWKGSTGNTVDAHFLKLVTETLTQEEKRLQIHQFAKMRIVQYFKRWFPWLWVWVMEQDQDAFKSYQTKMWERMSKVKVKVKCWCPLIYSSA